MDRDSAQDGSAARLMHHAVSDASRDLDAIAAAVYLVSEDETSLTAQMIMGSAPSTFMFDEVTSLDEYCASARAFHSGEVAGGLDLLSAEERSASPFPYIALAAPLADQGRSFGVLATLRLDIRGDYQPSDRARLAEIGDALAAAVAPFSRSERCVAARSTPVFVPVLDAGADTEGWGLSWVPGSAGTSMLYPLRRLSDRLNQVTTVDEVVAAARSYVMTPLRAQAVLLALAEEGRFWVIDHSGDSAEMARNLHGTRLDASIAAAEAVRGGPVFCPVDGAEPSRDSLLVHSNLTEAHLPLTGTHPMLDMPLIGGKRVIGVCSLSFDRARRFPPEERAVLSMMSGLLGSSISRVELNAQHRATAEHLQRRLLPATLPELPRLTAAGRYRPASVTSKVGGDWYDVIRAPGERLVLIVGDVEGHNLDSAAVMGQVRTALASYAAEGHRPAAVIDRTGRLLAQLGTDLLVTCCVVALDTADGTAEVARAGHPEPLVRKADGSIVTLGSPANLPLGVTPQYAYQGCEHTIPARSVLLLHSDGLVGTEAADPAAEVERLFAAADHDNGSQLEQVADRLMDDSEPWDRRDDAVLLLARYEGVADSGKPPRAAALHIQRRDLHGVKAARAFVDEHLRSWGLAELSDALQLATSEIVTNALIHAGSEVDIRLRVRADSVRLEVRDSDSDPPIPSPLALAEEENAEAEHGRGLLIVDAIAETWNTFPNGRGKTVSMDINIPAGEGDGDS